MSLEQSTKGLATHNEISPIAQSPISRSPSTVGGESMSGRSMSLQSNPADLVLRHGTSRTTFVLPDDLVAPPETQNTDNPMHPSEQKAVPTSLTQSFKAPVGMVMDVATTIHNLPKLYGDKTVRKNKEVTGAASGMKEASKELAYGFYDGFTGLVTMPIRGAFESGAIGCAKGVIQGSMGVLVKPVAAVSGFAGYSIQGIHKEFENRALKKEAAEACQQPAHDLEPKPTFRLVSSRKIRTLKSDKVVPRASEDTLRSEASSVAELPEDATAISTRHSKHLELETTSDVEDPFDIPPQYEEVEGESNSDFDIVSPSQSLHADNATSDHNPRGLDSAQDEGTLESNSATAESHEGSEETATPLARIRDSVRRVTDERYSAVIEQGQAIPYRSARASDRKQE